MYIIYVVQNTDATLFSVLCFLSWPPYPRVLVSFLRPVLIVTLNAIVFRNLGPNGADRTLDTCKNCHG